ncbi:MAG: MmgE/PrpD family protein, partial [Desulfurococcales archaeon]|nr:MmgE/PrpD family protein [Desulfurococcales archaeon]
MERIYSSTQTIASLELGVVDMTRISRVIAEWVHDLSYDGIPGEVIEEAKKRFVDSVGVALGAFNEEPVRIARAIAEGTGGARIPATLWGTGLRVAADHAGFANG